MNRRMLLSTAVLALLGASGTLHALSAQQAKRPAVTGAWKGIWGVYAPPPLPGDPPPKLNTTNYPSMRLDCSVVEKEGGKWQATFEGEAGRPYKYTIVMQGRQVGDSVLFQGSADLGEKDGGVYDWIGRATDTEFVGFFTNSKYTGSFRLSRPK